MNDRVYSYLAPPSPCGYLPDRSAQLEYQIIPGLSREKYLSMVKAGWRRFGEVLFRPRCSACTACQPIRILVNEFKPDRSQRRVQKANAHTELRIVSPQLDRERALLYYRHHEHHSEQKGWPEPNVTGGIQHVQQIITGPFQPEEWDYYIDGKLVAVSYIDHLGDGYSGIYFYYDPDFRDHSLGTWICLSLLDQAKLNGLPYVYLGYFVAGCRSMEYKGRFEPNEVLNEQGQWKRFRG